MTRNLPSRPCSTSEDSSSTTTPSGSSTASSLKVCEIRIYLGRQKLMLGGWWVVWDSEQRRDYYRWWVERGFLGLQGAGGSSLWVRRSVVFQVLRFFEVAYRVLYRVSVFLRNFYNKVGYYFPQTTDYLIQWVYPPPAQISILAIFFFIFYLTIQLPFPLILGFRVHQQQYQLLLTVTSLQKKYITSTYPYLQMLLGN